jgi:solute carrier family 39 (zinc transporter), member 1/2/3
MDTKSTKLYSILILFSISIAFSCIPLVIVFLINKLSKKKQKLNLIQSKYGLLSSYISCFAGGIFLATSMLHLVPDTITNMKALKDSMVDNSTSESSIIMSHSMNKNSPFLMRLSNFPLAEFFISLGIFLIMFVEQLISVIKSKKNQYNDNSSTVRFKKTNPGVRNRELIDSNNNSSAIMDESICLIDETKLNSIDDIIINDDNVFNKEKFNLNTNSIILLVSLSVHSIFEGLSIGLQDNKQVLLNIITAISIHKAIIAFSLSQQFVQAYNDFKKSEIKSYELKQLARSSFYLFIFIKNLIFSVSNPIGILMGILLIHIYPNLIPTLVISFIKAISTGTFLYITFFDILPNELNSSIGNGLLKVFCILSGFLFLSLITFFTE